MSATHAPNGFPEKQGLYDPQFEKDSCGVGFVAHVKGVASRQIVLDADHMLRRMNHRGGCGCEPNTGDGSGMLLAIPHPFFVRVVKEELGKTLPEKGHYGAGIVFLPRDAKEREYCKKKCEALIAEQGQVLVGWRKVPQMTDVADVGPAARASEPVMEQLIVGAAEGSNGKAFDADAFERKLYLIRKRASNLLRTDKSLKESKTFYVVSLSSKVIIYKGMLTPDQVMPYYSDMQAEDFVSHLAMVHSRFSTNTFPSWDRAQPLRFMSHNGEINTLRGNQNWMRARQGAAKSELFGEELSKLFPIVEPDCSDSGSFDNVLEFLLLGGRSLQESVMMMVPEAWQNHRTMSETKRAFYEYQSCLMEPWDGPASIVFTDGKYIGAVLDRNGLRPSRYYLTHDDRVIMASEVGVVEIDPALVKEKGRLQPGRMFLVNFDEGRLIPDEELKEEFARRQPYAQWLRENRIELSELHTEEEPHGFYQDTLLARMQAFGYTVETMQFMLLPMIKEKRDPLGSMGNDSALACLSDQPRLLYDYFKQLFAQVTNPAIDSIREELIMTLERYIGPEQNLLEPGPGHAHRLLVPHPILTNEELAALRHLDHRGWKSRVIDMTFPRSEGKAGMGKALDRICAEAEAAIDAGDSLVILSDREVSADRVPISSLLATGAVHHHLVRCEKRTRIGLIVESGEAREVHHHCLLVGYGADAVNPYLAFESLWQAHRDGLLSGESFVGAPEVVDKKIVESYRKGVRKGILKVMAKMGISTLQSYNGAQIFEALGIKDEVIERCFAGTASRVQGVSFDVIAEETLRRHTLGYPTDGRTRNPQLPNPGEFHWRAEGEKHAWEPQTIAKLQIAARTGDKNAYWDFAKICDGEAKRLRTLRGLLKFKPAPNGSIPIEEVEPASAIVKRFCTGAMSFGSISAEAHESLAIAMNSMGGKSNTGEGGEDPARYAPMPDGSRNPRRSAIKQVASGRFGVTIDYLTNADELQIKISQGAKPGEGGELPGKKVDANIARIRHSTPGVGLISPPPHHDIYSIEDLAQLIHDLKNSNPAARISVKLVAEAGVGTVATGVAKAHADHILIAGDSGGTGASPLTSIKHAGLPWELGLAETHQTLVLNDLRSRVTLQTDGGLKTGRDVVLAAMLGAEEMGFATAPLIALGCIMMRKCHLNTCPVGIATQDPELRKKFAGKPEHVVNYLFMVAEDARRVMAELGFKNLDDLVGRTDLLEADEAIAHWKADGLDLEPLLRPARRAHSGVGIRKTMDQDHGLDHSLDVTKIVPACEPAIERGEPVKAEFDIVNINRTVGTILSHELTKRYGAAGLAQDTVHLKFNGSAGQSFGAFLAPGVTLELEGDANDYVGKGLSGGRIVIYPPKNSGFAAEDNILIGNVVLYGAIKGECFFRGRAAERFCVRNSGAEVVVEGVGDHGLEYMTGGRAVILGPTGRNFAAGMSGGMAYVWDKAGDFDLKCNLEMVELEPLDEQDVAYVRDAVARHVEYTGSAVGQRVLDEWDTIGGQFKKVMPIDYKLALQQRKVRSGDEEEETASAGAGAPMVVRQKEV